MFLLALALRVNTSNKHTTLIGDVSHAGMVEVAIVAVLDQWEPYEYHITEYTKFATYISTVPETLWKPGDSIGLSLLYNDSGVYNLLFNDRNEPDTGNNDFSIVIETFLNPGNGSYLDLIIYYPYCANLSDTWIIKQDTSLSLSNQSEIDFMHGLFEDALSSFASISLSLKHSMACLALKVVISTAQIQMDELRNSSIFLSGLRHNGTFNTYNGTAAADEDALPLDDWNITGSSSYQASDDFVYCDVIVFPQTLENGIRVSIVDANESYLCNTTLQIQNLEAGTYYSWTISLDSPPETYTFTESNTFTQSILKEGIKELSGNRGQRER